MPSLHLRLPSRDWQGLRSVGNLRFLKVSYFILAVGPLISEKRSAGEILSLDPVYLGILYFASLFLAIANLIYDISCPDIVKRYASWSDYYEANLKIGQMATLVYPEDHFHGSLEFSRTRYEAAVQSKSFMRLTASTSYYISIVLFAYVFISRSAIVLKSMFG